MKNIINKKTMLAAVVGVVFMGNAYATPVNINITGKVIAAACTIDSPSGVNVDLGDISATTLAAVGAQSNQVPFSLTLSGCPASTTGVTMTLSGTADAANPTMFANTGTAAVAVAIEKKADSSALSNNSAWAVPVAANAASFDMYARVSALANGTLPGTITSTVVADFTYQ